MLRIIGAVVARTWNELKRYPSALASLVLWPVAFPAGYIFLARALAGPNGAHTAAGVSDYTSFVIVGTTLWMWVNISLWNAGGALREEQRQGTLEALWLTPASRFTILAGAAIGNSLLMVFQVAVATALYILIWGLQVHQPLASLLLWFANIPWVFGMSVLFASLVLWAKDANGMVQLVRGVFMILCGMTYPVAVLPGWLQGVSWVLPLTHGIRALRATVVRGAPAAACLGDAAWLLGWGAVLLVAGWFAFRWTDQRMHHMGTVAHY